jgi:hypothetical protein
MRSVKFLPRWLTPRVESEPYDPPQDDPPQGEVAENEASGFRGPNPPTDLQEARRAAKKRYQLVAEGLKREAGVRRHYTWAHRVITTPTRALAGLPGSVLERSLRPMALRVGSSMFWPTNVGTSCCTVLQQHGISPDTSRNIRPRRMPIGRSNATAWKCPRNQHNGRGPMWAKDERAASHDPLLNALLNI